MVLVGIFPIAIIVMLALHLTVKNPAMRLIALGSGVACGVCLHSNIVMIICVVMLCIEIIIQKLLK